MSENPDSQQVYKRAEEYLNAEGVEASREDIEAAIKRVQEQYPPQMAGGHAIGMFVLDELQKIGLAFKPSVPENISKDDVDPIALERIKGVQPEAGIVLQTAYIIKNAENAKQVNRFTAAFRLTRDNWQILQPVFEQMCIKYPNIADEAILAIKSKGVTEFDDTFLKKYLIGMGNLPYVVLVHDPELGGDEHKDIRNKLKEIAIQVIFEKLQEYISE